MTNNGRDYRTELQETTSLIGEYFFLDPERKKVGSDVIPNWNVTLLTLSYVMDQNPLIVGEPGFGKTTAAKVISCMMSGYPFDLYEAAQIQGHPDQTYETMIARPDFSKLSREESVIWLTSAYLPVRIIDEINRLPAGNQDELLNTLQTGRFNYLNATFFTGRTPFFATANHPDDGNHILIPPMRDRFSVHVELGDIGSVHEDEIEVAENNIGELCNSELTGQIMEIVNDKSMEVEAKLDLIDKRRGQYINFLHSDTIGTYLFDAEDRKAVTKQIRSIPLSDEALVLRNLIKSEINYTPTFGRKRSNDKVDTSNHAQELASTCVMNALSPRATGALKGYAQGLAYLIGAEKVRKEHIVAVAPHVMGHRLEFTTDFRGQFEDKRREGIYGMPMEMHLSSHLIEKIEKNYSKAKKEIDLLIQAYKAPEKLSDNLRKKANEMLSGEIELDHPLLKELVRALKERKEQF